MAGIRNSRTRVLTAAATVALAALSLTACNDGTGTVDEGSSTAASASASTGANSRTTPPTSTSPAASASKATATAGTSGSSPASGTRGSSGAGAQPTPTAARHTGGTGGGTGSNKPVTCEGSTTKMVAAPLNRPVNHMLLTVTNTGSRTCYLYGYPALRFTGAQAVPPVIDDSHPQAVVTLGPGESGYASVNLSSADGSGSYGHTVKSLTVYFQGRSGDWNAGKAAHPALPAKGVYIDDTLKVTYWQQSMDDAIDW
jgi:hypothetical protein